MTMNTYRFTLNGTAQEVVALPDQSLPEILREEFGITSAKNGCAPQGQCGACLVLVNGTPKASCAVIMAKADGKDILTLEGVSEDERRLYARAYQAAAGLQCGFCTPGLVLRTKSLTDRH
jgi:xanthine dehydrogenase molybdenum-binding subunit